MSLKCCDLVNVLEKYIPVRLAEEWDTVGLQTGSLDSEVRKIFFTLDLNEDVMREALEYGADFIFVHHTPLFEKTSFLTSRTAQGRIVRDLIKNDINLFCAHTNLDAAAGGINDILAFLLGLLKVSVLQGYPERSEGLGRVGFLPAPVTLKEFAGKTADILGTGDIRYCGADETVVDKVALCGGSGMDLLEDVLNSSADVFLTSDIKYHDAQKALDHGVALVDGGHFSTEKVFLPVLAEKLHMELRDCGDINIMVSRTDTNPFTFLKR